MKNGLIISNIFCNFEGWIGRICKPSDKGKLTAFPRFTICQPKFNNVSNMLRFEELPEVNSPKWLSLEDLEGEGWRSIEGFDGVYMVSNYGRIKSLSRCRRNKWNRFVLKERIMRVGFRQGGYVSIALTTTPNKVIRKPVHVVVAEAFIPNTNNKPQVDHINTIRVDNRVCNLRWVTCKENAKCGRQR